MRISSFGVTWLRFWGLVAYLEKPLVTSTVREKELFFGVKDMSSTNSCLLCTAISGSAPVAPLGGLPAFTRNTPPSLTISIGTPFVGFAFEELR